MVLKWYVAKTEPRFENRAAEALLREGVEHYFPRLLDHKSLQKNRLLPLFPGYLFIKWDLESQIFPFLNSAYRITGWLRFGDVVPSIPEDVLTDLSERVDAINSGTHFEKNFSVGEEVVIASGVFQGLAQVIREAKSPCDRALVLIDFMGRLVEVNVPWADLSPSCEEPTTSLNQLARIKRPRRTRGRGRQVHATGKHLENVSS